MTSEFLVATRSGQVQSLGQTISEDPTFVFPLEFDHLNHRCRKMGKGFEFLKLAGNPHPDLFVDVPRPVASASRNRCGGHRSIDGVAPVELQQSLQPLPCLVGGHHLMAASIHGLSRPEAGQTPGWAPGLFSVGELP